MTESWKDKRILFYDGVCALCLREVDYILSHNPPEDLFFSSLQSDYAQKLLPHLGINPKDSDTFVFLDYGKMYLRSEAVFRLSNLISGKLAALINALRFVPRFLSDGVYRFIAINRYRIGHKKETCPVPPTEHRHRFLN